MHVSLSRHMNHLHQVRVTMDRTRGKKSVEETVGSFQDDDLLDSSRTSWFHPRQQTREQSYESQLIKIDKRGLTTYNDSQHYIKEVY